MLPRERIEAALSYRTPDRVPLQVHPSPAGLYEHGTKLLDLMRSLPDDFCDPASFRMPEPPAAADFDADGRYHAIRTDAWGTTWEYRIFGIWGHPIRRPLDDLAALPGWRAPDPPPDGPALAAARAGADARRGTWYIVEDAGALFETLRWVRRFEDILMDMEDDTPEINRVADIINGYNKALVRRALHLDADAVSFGDDLGTQESLMISPAAFRRFLKPRYRELFAPVVAAGKKVFFHTCGQVTSALEDLREVGANLVWPQLPLYDLHDLAKRCRDLGMAVLLHPDRGDLMQRETPSRVRDYVLRLVDTFDSAHGGSILYIEIDPGFPWPNVQALFEAAREVCR